MQIKGSVALVTGANRGLGRHFAEQLLQRGATKVYAAARDPRTIDLPVSWLNGLGVDELLKLN